MSPTRSRRGGNATGFGLAFLDVLCCGLGSAVFLLLVIQRGPAPVAAEDVLVADGMARAESEMQAAGLRIAELRGSITTVAEAIQAAMAGVQAVAGLSEQQKRQAADALASLREERERLDAETATISELRARIPAPPVTPRQHLTGLGVDEDRVVVFLDSSASMLDSSLVEILRLRVSGVHLKQAAGKWTTARNAAKWIYGRIPKGGRYRLFHYAEDLRDVSVGAVPPGSLGWREKTPNAHPAASDPVEAALDAIVPHGPTNLHQVFETAARLSPPPVQIVLVTDGLPTLPGDTPLGRLRSCKRPRGNTTPLITARCRARIFEDATKTVGRMLPHTRIDVILLPLQGDADAAGRYWDLALSAGGRLLAPAKGWPET